MTAAIDWDELSHAAAFLLGAALATIATLRVVRHVAAFFAQIQRPREDDEPRRGP